RGRVQDGTCTHMLQRPVHRGELGGGQGAASRLLPEFRLNLERVAPLDAVVLLHVPQDPRSEIAEADPLGPSFEFDQVEQASVGGPIRQRPRWHAQVAAHPFDVRVPVEQRPEVLPPGILVVPTAELVLPIRPNDDTALVVAIVRLAEVGTYPELIVAFTLPVLDAVLTITAFEDLGQYLAGGGRV